MFGWFDLASYVPCSPEGSGLTRDATSLLGPTWLFQSSVSAIALYSFVHSRQYQNSPSPNLTSNISTINNGLGDGTLELWNSGTLGIRKGRKGFPRIVLMEEQWR